MMNRHSEQPQQNKETGSHKDEGNPSSNKASDTYVLIQQYQQHASEEVKTALVQQYEDLVKSLARKFAKNADLYEDLYQVGMLGLLAALSRYDHTYGRSFESFAVPTIVGEIKRFLRDKTWSVHVPRRIKELGPKVRHAVEELTTQLQRSPRTNEIAEYIGTNEEEVLETMEMSRSYQALSVDSALEMDQEGSTMTLLDMIGDSDEGYEQIQQNLLIEKLFQVLSERERVILQYTFIHGLSQQEAGDKLNISQMHVSRLQRRALKKIKESMDVESSELMK